MASQPAVPLAEFGPITDNMLAELGRSADRAALGDAGSNTEVLVLLAAMPAIVRELAEWRQVGKNLIVRMDQCEVMGFPRLVE